MAVQAALRQTCYEAVLGFALLCIDRIDFIPESFQVVGRLGELLAGVGCDSHAVYRCLIRKMTFVEMTTVELSPHRWTAEPRVLGQEIAAAWDTIFLAFDLKTFAAGACLLRLIPEEALWPVANAILSDFNTPRTLSVCGYPKEPSQIFGLVLKVLVERDMAFQLYISGRLRACCGEAQAAWFLRHVAAVDAAKSTAKVMPESTAGKKAGKKRKRESA